MIRVSRFHALLLASLAGSSLAGAQVLRAQQVGTHLSAAGEGSVRALADSLRGEGLPADAVLAKAAEGSLKGASEARILAAVRTLARELRDARGALGAPATAGEIVAAATALHAGASPDALRQLRAAVPDDAPAGRLAVPLVVVADLVSRGASPRVAVESVRGLLARRAGDDVLEMMRASVERDVLAGMRADQALLARSRALGDTLSGATGATRPLPTVRPHGP